MISGQNLIGMTSNSDPVMMILGAGTAFDSGPELYTCQHVRFGSDHCVAIAITCCTLYLVHVEEVVPLDC